MYIESNNRKILLHTASETFEYYEKMYVLEDLLKGEGFVRCHQSYMVSKHYVTDYNSIEIYMKDVVLPIGRKYREQVYHFLGRETGYLLQDAPKEENEVDRAEKKEKVTEKQGVLTGVAGGCQGVVFNFRPEQRILVGRDGKAVDLVVNLPKVSRLHCVIVYHQQDDTYEITDFSRNGTYLSGGKRLVSDTSYCVKAGTRISFGDVDNIYCLG